MAIPRSRKLMLFGLLGLVGLVVLAVACLYLLVDACFNKARFEATSSEALGLDVKIDGRLRIGFFPGLRVTLEDLHVRNRGSDVAVAKEARLEIDLFPLLENELRIEKISLKSPKFTIERNRDGHLNFESMTAAGESLPTLDWPNVSLSEATLHFADRSAAEEFEASDCRLDMHRLHLSGGRRLDIMRALSFTAQIACGEVRGEGFTVSELQFTVDAKSGRLDLDRATTQVFGTQGSGSIRADFSGAVPLYEVRVALPQLRIEDFFKIMSRQTVATGRMDFSAVLSMQGDTWKQMRQTAKGRISLGGKNVKLQGEDLDRAYSRFESSQKFNLVDVGAVFFVGPLGLLVTKGYDFASILQGSGGSSEIRTLVSDWNVERGVAQAQDVAMATKENRIALQGGLDFVNDEFHDVTIALVDATGCTKVRQKMHGSFQAPVVESPNLLKSVTGPAVRLLKKGGDLLLGKHCEVFYAGTVAAPK